MHSNVPIQDNGIVTNAWLQEKELYLGMCWKILILQKFRFQKKLIVFWKNDLSYRL